MTTLGDALKALRTAQASGFNAETQFQKALDALESDRIATLVANRISHIQRIIELYLIAGKEVPYLPIGEEESDAEVARAVHMHSWGSDGPKPTQPFYNEFKKLKDWGLTNGLNIQYTYAHCGTGMRSWYTVNVSPL